MTAAPILLSVSHAAEAVDLSERELRRAIAASELVPVFRGTKPLILRDELDEWARNLPRERRAS